MAQPSDPQIIECEIRLHDGRPGGDKTPAEYLVVEWDGTAIGPSVPFQALADVASGLWNGPLAPGVDVSPPRVVEDPWWTVRLPGSHGVPVRVGQVGRSLDIGEAFTLPAGETGMWESDVVFEGTIITA